MFLRDLADDDLTPAESDVRHRRRLARVWGEEPEDQRDFVHRQLGLRPWPGGRIAPIGWRDLRKARKHRVRAPWAPPSRAGACGACRAWAPGRRPAVHPGGRGEGDRCCRGPS